MKIWTEINEISSMFKDNILPETKNSYKNIILDEIFDGSNINYDTILEKINNEFWNNSLVSGKKNKLQILLSGKHFDKKTVNELVREIIYTANGFQHIKEEVYKNVQIEEFHCLNCGNENVNLDYDFRYVYCHKCEIGFKKCLFFDYVLIGIKAKWVIRCPNCYCHIEDTDKSCPLCRIQFL